MNARDRRTPTPEGLPLEAQAMSSTLDMVHIAMAPGHAMTEAPSLPAPTSMVVTPSRPMTPQQVEAPTPMALLTIAMNQGADLDRLERLMAMQERWEENEARRAYFAAFAAFKAESVQIIKNIKVNDGPLKGKAYADLFAAVDAATPALSKHGLSANWRLTKDDKDWLEVTCILRHALGHSESVAMGGPPDTGGAKNAVQARASTMSYLERYTFLAITGLASSDGDKDGATLPSDQVADDCAYLSKAPTLGDLQGRFKEVYPKAAKDKTAQAALMKAKDNRKAELTAGGAR